MPPARTRMLYAGSLLVAAIAGIALVLLFGKNPPPPPAPPVTQPTDATTQPSPPAATTLSAPPMRTYPQLLAADFPNNPTTTAPSEALDLADAAHLLIPRRVYLCPRGDLWFSDPSADPLPKVLARAGDETEHIADRDVEYVLWTVDTRGNQIASAVCRTNDGFELVTSTDAKPIPNRPGLDWSRAMNWDDNGATRLIVPTPDGISIITVDTQLSESYFPLRPTGSGPKPQFLFDLRGLLAWIPADDSVQPGNVVARFVDGHWLKLDPTAWPPSILHLVPLLGGSVMQIRRGDDPQSVQLITEPLDPQSIDEKKIEALVDQLDDPDPDKRTDAFQRITAYGADAYPLLQQLRPAASPTAGPRIDQILASANRATLGVMDIQDNLLTVTARLSDGGAVFFAPHGVSVPSEGQLPQLVNPAYLVIRPGRYVELLPSGLSRKMDEQTRLAAFHDEWIAEKPPLSPARFLPPDELTPLLRSSETEFTQWLGFDNHGRWIFRRPGAPKPTLILDPTVIDPSPRLAVWMIDSGGDVGWNAAGWPVVQRRSDRWILTNHDWELLAKTDTAQTTPAPQGNLLLQDSSGNKYLDGRSTLSVVRPNGREDIWTLPQEIAGSQDFQPWLVSIAQNRLLLFNANGRIVRLRPDGAGFAVEAIFDHRLSFLRSIRRVWTDPAGRVAVSYADQYLAIIFPDGRVDPAIADQILPANLKRIEPR